MHRRNNFRPLLIGLMIFLMLVMVVSLDVIAQDSQKQDNDDDNEHYGVEEARKVVQHPKRWITADHSEFDELQQDFQTGPQVTEACLSCHNQAAIQFHKTIHWTWICPADPRELMGKNGMTMNNF